MPLLPDIQHSDEDRLLATRARVVCRDWAQVRVGLLPLFDAHPGLREFDVEMFALGEIVQKSTRPNRCNAYLELDEERSGTCNREAGHPGVHSLAGEQAGA